MAGRPFHETTQRMSESRILVRLLRMYFPRNREFGSALSKLRNFGAGFEPPTPLPRYTTGDEVSPIMSTRKY